MATSLQSRPWSSRADLALMQALARSRLEMDWPAVHIHPGDLDWWVVQSFGATPAIDERVRLWFDGGVLRAYAWHSLSGQLDFQTASTAADEVNVLVREIVAWADDRRTNLAGTAAPRPLKAWASADDPAGAALESMGLAADPHDGFVLLTGDLSSADRWMPLPLPDGMAIRPLTDADVEARVTCSRAAFPHSTMSPERYRRTLDANLYRQDLDLLLVDDDGRVAAFALGWLDHETGSVELEPVGVHPDYHRRGLGRAICRAVLRRARDLGARRAVIGAEADNPASVGLYQSLDLSIATQLHPYGRPPTGS